MLYYYCDSYRHGNKFKYDKFFWGGYWGSSLNAANPTHIGKHIDIMEELFPADYIDLFIIGVMIWQEDYP